MGPSSNLRLGIEDLEVLWIVGGCTFNSGSVDIDKASKVMTPLICLFSGNNTANNEGSGALELVDCGWIELTQAGSID